jgi:hypothetical protein
MAHPNPTLDNDPELRDLYDRLSVVRQAISDRWYEHLDAAVREHYPDATEYQVTEASGDGTLVVASVRLRSGQELTSEGGAYSTAPRLPFEFHTAVALIMAPLSEFGDARRRTLSA